MRQSKQRSSEAAFSILTLDDDQSLTSTVQHYFQRCGYRVESTFYRQFRDYYGMTPKQYRSGLRQPQE